MVVLPFPIWGGRTFKKERYDSASCAGRPVWKEVTGTVKLAAQDVELCHVRTYMREGRCGHV